MMSIKFLDWLDEWFRELKSVRFAELYIKPDKTALVSVDMVKGFCSIGPLASDDVAAIIPDLVEFFEKSYQLGIKKYLLFQDTHDSKTPEFGSFPPHCLKGSKEAETIDELANLPFSDEFIIFEKNSLSPAYRTGFDKWLSVNKGIENFIIVGNCTDLCIYSHAMHLSLSANAFNLKRRIIIPENCVATYDMPVDTARKLKVIPHDREFLHKLFLYHLALNGVEIVRSIA